MNGSTQLLLLWQPYEWFRLKSRIQLQLRMLTRSAINYSELRSNHIQCIDVIDVLLLCIFTCSMTFFGGLYCQIRLTR